MKKIKRFLIIFFSIGIILFLVNFISGYFSQRVEVYVRQKAILNASSIIEEAIKNEVLPTLDIDNLVSMKTNENQEVQNVLINTRQINEIVALVNKSVYDNIRKIEKKEELNNLTLPLGIILSDTLFGNSGPKFKIKISPVGAVKSDIITSVKDYGINSSILNIDIVVKITFNTIIPLNKDEIEVVTKIPVVVQIINANVPQYYYYGDLGKAPVDFD